MKTTFRLALVAWSVAIVLAAGEAQAEQTTLMVVGEVARWEENALRTVAQRAAEEAGWTVLESELSTRASSELLVCLQQPRTEREGCVSGFFETTRAQRAVVLRVTSEIAGGKKWRVVGGWVFRRSGRTLAFEERSCQNCQSAGLAHTARTVVGLIIRAARSAATPSVLAIRSRPPGARITLDGRIIGATDVAVKVYPGRHIVRLEKRGYRAATRQLLVDDGEQAELDVKLDASGTAVVDTRPSPATRDAPPTESAGSRKAGHAMSPKPEEEPRRKDRRTRVVPWLLIGGGSAVAAIGGVLMVVGTRETFDDQGQRQTGRHRPSPLAGGITAVGGLAVGAGIVFLWQGSRHDGKPAPVVSVDGQTAWMGVRGAF